MKARRIAKQRALQAARKHRIHYTSSVYAFWALDPTVQDQTDQDAEMLQPIPRPRALAESDEPVDVYVSLSYPLTDAVPEHVRDRNFQARTVLDVCNEIRSMYQAIYAEDERLGGPQAAETGEPLSHGFEHSHMAELRRKGYKLMNRGFGNWVWGHDLSDLVIEILDFDWIKPDHVHVDVFIGS